ncbi:MAG TPA: hypothetical protein VKN35_01770, partial [Xanthomonadales bacterium]|nr:hypothetical protein [Xanthomonadales bacterium]
MNKLSKLFLISLTVLIASTFSLLHAQSNSGENNWPRTLTLVGGTATLYPMQVESMEGDLIRYRAAISYLENGQTDPVFGAGWFESNVEIDRDKDIVHPLDFTVTETRFPAGSVDIKEELTRAVAARMPSWNLDFPVEDLLASLEAAELEAKSAENLNTQPPQILYRDHPALLVTIDGEPVLRSIENSNLQAVVNTPYPLIVDGNNYYLNAADKVWYRASAATGPYQFEPKPPSAVSALVGAESQGIEKAASTEVVTASNAPEIVVVTQPSELIVTEGPAAFVPLVDDLLVLDNTEDDVFMHISSQQYYVVLAGRWYHAKSLNGPWEYRAADNLPPAFASIPPESEQAGSRVYVAGTDEAKEAVLDAQVPTTAAVARGTVD